MKRKVHIWSYVHKTPIDDHNRLCYYVYVKWCYAVQPKVSKGISLPLQCRQCINM